MRGEELSRHRLIGISLFSLLLLSLYLPQMRWSTSDKISARLPAAPLSYQMLRPAILLVRTIVQHTSYLPTRSASYPTYCSANRQNVRTDFIVCTTGRF